MGVVVRSQRALMGGFHLISRMKMGVVVES
jgi:hypothetical protein